MSRSENIAVVESYLDGLARKDLSSVPFAPGMTFEGPLMPKLAGRETILGFLTSILPLIRGIEIKQHIVDGNYVATVFDMETINGVDHVIDLCLVVGGEIERGSGLLLSKPGPSLDHYVGRRPEQRSPPTVSPTILQRVPGFSGVPPPADVPHHSRSLRRQNS